MLPDRLAADSSARPVVLFPCHTLDDLPTWLDDREADDLLAAWTAAWHPRLMAVAGVPRWSGVDLPLPADTRLGIVPATWDDRFAAQFDTSAAGDVPLVRATRGRAAITASALAAVNAPTVGTGDSWAEDFHALGLAVLLSEVLARRMRHGSALDATGFDAVAGAAATAAGAGRDDDVRAGLAECYRCLESTRARYYPVDAWVVDLVLVTSSTVERLSEELTAPVPLGIVADPGVAAALGERGGDSLARLVDRVVAGDATLCGGPFTDRPLDALLPEEILDACTAAAAEWDRAIGLRPAVFARRGGGGSAILPGVVSGLGFVGAVWNTFDGAPLPDPGTGRIVWEGTGGATIDGLARPPLDARSPAAILAMPERLGDAMDHDHVAVITFAHHAGTACPWHALLRRVGGWSTALGTFVAPARFFEQTSGMGGVAAFGPDAFPPSKPPVQQGDAVGAAVEAASSAARRVVERVAALAPVAPAPVTAAPAVPLTDPARGLARGFRGWWAGSRRAEGDWVLESDRIRVEVHPDTGGMLSLRRPGAGPNRISQQLAVRRPAGHGRMQADAIDRGVTASGREGIVSRGRLLDVDGRDAGSFVQGIAIVAGQPLVALDLAVTLNAPLAGPLAEQHVGCRFAWHENEDVDLRRSIHAQSVATTRTRFTAPHFVEIVPVTRRAAVDAVTILTGGLPWHERSSPHVLDTILGNATATRRLAVGIGLERPWDAALEFLAGLAPGSGCRLGPDTVRVTVQDVERVDGRLVRARVGLVESAGRAGEVRLDWAGAIRGAAARELDGRPRPDATVAIEGRAVIVFLRAYEWFVVDLEFGA